MSRTRLHLRSSTPFGAAFLYDTSIGSGVDANGGATLPLRSGAKRYFVNSVGGSDSHTSTQAQDPTTPMATIAAARAYEPQYANNGSQFMLAEGSTFNEQIQSLHDLVGNSALYPTAFQSYDPTDALNESKYGRAGVTKRPKLTGATSVTHILPGGGTGGIGYYAFRGLNWDAGNIADAPGLSFQNVLYPILIENNVLSYTGIGLQRNTAATASQHVIRNNALYGSWSAVGTAGQGLFFSGLGITIEDNVFYHCAWKIGASRDDAVSSGGANFFKHPIYAEYDAGSFADFRRNLVMQGCADGGKFICPSFNVYNNLFVQNPLLQLGGKGSDYSVENPNGHQIQAYGNAIMEAIDINSTNPRGMGLYNFNGASGSAFHHNLIGRCATSLANGSTYAVGAEFNQPSYMNIHDNVSYLQNNSGLTKSEFGTYAPAQIFTTYANNIWDDPTSGSNTNQASATIPNKYTMAQIYALLTPTFPSISDEASFIAFVQNNPEKHVQHVARALLMAGAGNGLS